MLIQAFVRCKCHRLPLLQLSNIAELGARIWKRDYTSSSSSAAAAVTRDHVHQLFKKVRDALDEEKYHAEILGSYRREMPTIEEISILVTGVNDEREPSSSKEIYAEDSTQILQMLVRENILDCNSHFDGKQTFLSSQHPKSSVSLQYVPKICQGAARLYLTGDSSYIRFLKLMSIETMGLSLNMLGLWRANDMPSQDISPNLQSKSLLQSVEVEKIDKQESEGDRRMRETRKEMGLPEDLDLSLDLDTPSTDCTTSKFTQPKAKDLEAELIRQSEGIDSQERIPVGSGSEAEILDVLGLVWIPPRMRTVKGMA